MRHAWKPHHPPGMSNAELFMSEPYRKCDNCGKVQQRYTEYAWMRVKGYRWTPLVGRCK